MADEPVNPFALLMQSATNPSKEPPGSEVIQQDEKGQSSSKVIPGDDGLSIPSVATELTTDDLDEESSYPDEESSYPDEESSHPDVDYEVMRIDCMIQNVFLVTIDHGKEFCTWSDAGIDSWEIGNSFESLSLKNNVLDSWNH